MKLDATIRTENRPYETIIDGQDSVKRWFELSKLLDYRHTYCALTVNIAGDTCELLYSLYNENTQQIECTARYQNGSVKDEFYLDDYDDSDDVLEDLLR